MNGNGISEFLRAVVGYIMADRKRNEDRTKELEIYEGYSKINLRLAGKKSQK
jgi:hypothetical protein